MSSVRRVARGWEERPGCLGQEPGDQQCWTEQRKQSPHLFRGAGLYDLSPLCKHVHTRDRCVYVSIGLCLSCLPLRRKQASKATRFAGALAARPAGNTQLGYSYKVSSGPWVTSGFSFPLPPSLPSPLTLASFNFILVRVSLLLTFPHVFPK